MSLVMPGYSKRDVPFGVCTLGHSSHGLPWLAWACLGGLTATGFDLRDPPPLFRNAIVWLRAGGIALTTTADRERPEIQYAPIINRYMIMYSQNSIKVKSGKATPYYYMQAN